MKRMFLAVLLSLFAVSAFALPTVEQVQSEVSKGNYRHAEEMMQEVVAAKPGSAKAHYIYAEILAHNQRFDRASEEAAQARKLDPAIKFTQPDKFATFEQLLQKEQASEQAARNRAAERAAPVVQRPSSFAPEPRPMAASGSGIPGWIWLIVVGGIGFVIWRMLRSRTQAPQPVLSSPAYGSPGGYGPAPGYGPTPGVGSGLLGTGLAVAGGVAAGMLAEHLIEGRRENNLASDLGNPLGAASGGFDRPVDDGSARELEQRSIDFGSGDDWGSASDSDSGSSGGSDDSGGW